jgi:hypothetical protein
MNRFLLLAALTLNAASAGAQMTPGLWSLGVTMEANGRKQAMPAVTQCITQADIDDPARTLPRPQGKCTLSNVQRTAGRATYDLACIDGSLQSIGRADVVFEPERYYGNVSMSMSEKGAPAQLVQMQMLARRAGECR